MGRYAQARKRGTGKEPVGFPLAAPLAPVLGDAGGGDMSIDWSANIPYPAVFIATVIDGVFADSEVSTNDLTTLTVGLGPHTVVQYWDDGLSNRLSADSPPSNIVLVLP